MSFTPQAADAGRGGVIGTAVFSVIAVRGGGFALDNVVYAGAIASVDLQDAAHIDGVKITFAEAQPDLNYIVSVLATDFYFGIMDTAAQNYQDASVTDFGIFFTGSAAPEITRVYVTVIRL